MTNGEAPGFGPGLTKPQTRAAQAWRHVITVLYRDIPAGTKRSARARARMQRRR